MGKTFDTEMIRIITLFENMTGAKVKDCLQENKNLYMIVEEGDAAKAIGKNGMVVKNVENVIKKNIRIFEFSPDVTRFAKNLFPKAVEIIAKNDGKLIEVKVEKKDRANIIGRDGKNLKIFKELLKRSHNVELVLR